MNAIESMNPIEEIYQIDECDCSVPLKNAQWGGSGARGYRVRSRLVTILKSEKFALSTARESPRQPARAKTGSRPDNTTSQIIRKIKVN